MHKRTMLVSVCICTFRRVAVADAIRSVLAQQGVRWSGLEIVVCDDDPGQSARSIVEAVGADHSAMIRYVVSGAQNVSLCRNKCLESALGDWVVFIDDDEIAEPDWLSEFIAAQNAYRADLVKGYVRAVYPADTPDWIVTGDPFTRAFGATGSRPAAFGAGNVMFRRSIVVKGRITFDPAYGPSGGEDIDFFRRYAELGATIIACRSAVVWEIVPPERTTASYLARRERRNGHNYARVFCGRMSRARRTLTLMRSAALVVACSSYPLARILRSARSYRSFAKFWVHIGVIEWILGRPTPRLENPVGMSPRPPST